MSYPGEGFWSDEKDGLHVIGSHCTKCGQIYFPPREICPEHFAKGVVKSRKCPSKNPYAQFTKETTVEEVLNPRMIADPLTLFQCCPRGDGAVKDPKIGLT